MQTWVLFGPRATLGTFDRLWPAPHRYNWKLQNKHIFWFYLVEQNWLALVYRGIVSFSQRTDPCIPPGTAQHKQKVHKQHCFIAITHVRRSPPLFFINNPNVHALSKTWWLTTMWPCRQRGSTQTEMRSKTPPTTLRWPHRSLARSWSTRATYSSSAPSEFGTEEAFWREGTSF